MENRTILVGLAATFIGLTALLLVGGVVVSPVLLAVAVPFGIVAYLLWYHASGRLRDRMHVEADRLGPTERERAKQRARAAQNRRDAYRAAGDGGRAGGATAGRDPRDRAPSTGGMTEREAYETLDLDRTADRETIRSRYRERAKRLHPDGEDGDEDAFKDLNRAYETLTE